MNMNILVTGGAGFIGSHIVERLLKDGHYVRVLDNFSSGKRENLSVVIARSPAKGGTTKPFDTSTSSASSRATSRDDKSSGLRPEHSRRTKQSQNFELIEGDIRDYNTCLKACDSIDYVLHQAALRSVPKSMTMPHEYNAVNIDGNVNMLEAALKNKVKRFVYASSSSVYGEAKSFPQKETDPNYLVSPYALTKLAEEYYARVFSVNYGIETVGLRYFNVFGPRQALDDDYAVVIPKFIDCMLNNKQPPIHGTGKQSRDFTYVDNVVEANILAATVPVSSLRGSDLSSSLRGSEAAEAISKTFCEVFNVACGQEKSVLDIVDTINDILGKSIKPVFGPIRAGDVFRTSADISKIGKVLGFRPKVSFEEGLRNTVEWFRKQAINV